VALRATAWLEDGEFEAEIDFDRVGVIVGQEEAGTQRKEPFRKQYGKLQD
jgi:hypothetical protein